MGIYFIDKYFIFNHRKARVSKYDEFIDEEIERAHELEAKNGNETERAFQKKQRLKKSVEKEFDGQEFEK